MFRLKFFCKCVIRNVSAVPVYHGVVDGQLSRRVGLKSLLHHPLNTAKFCSVVNSTVPISSKELDRVQRSRLEQQYPSPSTSLNNIMQAVYSELKNPDFKLSLVYSKVGPKSMKEWKCSCVMKWPVTTSFSAVSKRKADTTRRVCLDILHWLIQQGKLKNGKLVLYDKETVEALKQSIVETRLPAEDMPQIKLLCDVYNKEIRDIIQRRKELQAVNEASETIYQEYKPSNAQLMNRSLDMYERYRQRMRSGLEERSLPMWDQEQELLEAVKTHPVVMVRGEPGCGKSTQVVQMLMNQWVARREGALCNIMVTQPRRISAISLAERVASEMGVSVGDTVGYHVRFNRKVPHLPGGIIYCTTGIALRMLQEDRYLKGVSHFILDEAHERDISIDMLMMLLKETLTSADHSLKLIIMSATLNSHTIADYFSNVPVINVPGRLYPVSTYHLQDIPPQVPLTYMRASREDNTSPRINPEEVSEVIAWLDREKPPGGILVFLPGWAEIRAVQNRLAYKLRPSGCEVIPLHGRLPVEEQTKVFGQLPPGVRKVVLATNVAETSVTVADIVYVVDCGVHKEDRLTENGMSSLGNRWISRANADQRRGRAGRVMPGECYRLYSAAKCNSLDAFPQPEIQRVPLDKVVLDLKMFDENKTAAEVLSLMVEPPAPEAVKKAVADLSSLGALNADEKLTVLGRKIGALALHPRLSKALVWAAALKCLSPVLTVTSLLSSNAEPFNCTPDNKDKSVSVKRRRHRHSDHLALTKLYDEWEELRNTDGMGAAHDFCETNLIREETFAFVRKLRRVTLEQLVESQILDRRAAETVESDATCNELVLGVLLAGLSSYATQRHWDLKKGRISTNSSILITEGGARASVVTSSVNHKQPDPLPSPYLVYCDGVTSLERRMVMLRETSVVSPLCLTLFMDATFKRPVSSQDDFVNVLLPTRSPCRIRIPSEQAEVVANLQELLHAVVEYLYSYEGRNRVLDSDYNTVSTFRDQLVQALSTVLPRVIHNTRTHLDPPTPAS